MKVGLGLKDLRRLRGFSQAELGKASGVHPVYLCDLENNKKNPSIKTLEKLLRVLNCPLSKFFKNIESKQMEGNG